MKEVMHFKSVQEMIHFLNAKPVEPKKFAEKKEEKPKKKKVKKDEVLQAD